MTEKYNEVYSLLNELISKYHDISLTDSSLILGKNWIDIFHKYQLSVLIRESTT